MSAAPSSSAECVGAFEATLAAKDLDAGMALLTSDVVFFYSNGSAHFGKAAIRAAIQENFDTIQDDTYATSDIIWIAQSDTAAACIYSFAWRGMIDGKSVGARGRGTTVLRREPQGWRIVHEHLSAGRWQPRRS